ncbi:MAG: beta-galactosidase, partial [Eubacterium sp.]|nr:beta-galactosidase [Eubacterium sp.]
PGKGKVYLKIYYYQKIEEELTPAGHLLGFDEILLPNQDGTNSRVAEILQIIQAAGGTDQPALSGEVDHVPDCQVEETDTRLTWSDGSYVWDYNKKTGMIDNVMVPGTTTDLLQGVMVPGTIRKLLGEPVKISLWRAPTDNDRQIKEEWLRAGYDRTYTRAYHTDWKKEDEGIRIRSRIGLLADGLQKIMDIRASYRIRKEGSLEIRMDVERNMDFPELPRFGLRFLLPDRLRHVEYYGMGPTESYADKHRGTSHGIYRQSVEENHEDYIRPQENGSHYDCDYVWLKESDSREGAGLLVYGRNPFSFQVSLYTEEELTKKAHNYELIPSGYTVLHLDYRQNGIGSASCGPALLPRYRFEEERFTFSLKMNLIRPRVF